MPLHDFQCPCGQVRQDVYVPVAVRATDASVACGRCGARMAWVPAAPAVDLAFTPTAVEVQQPDGSHRTVTVSSLKQIRDLERTSEVRARNGEGQQMVWRSYSQDRSNDDASTLPGPERPSLTAAAKRKFGRRGAFKALGEEMPDRPLGPGVTEATASALVSE